MIARERKVRWMGWLLWMLVPVGLLLVVGANAHLLYVAIQTQSECVPHSKTAGDVLGYRAASPAC